MNNKLKYYNLCNLNIHLTYILTDFVNRFFELKNVAVGKPTDQSTTNGFLRSSYANDGNTKCRDRGFYRLSSTSLDSNTYWRIDLQRSAVVLNVTVKNRDDKHGNLINPFDIRVGYTKANGGLSNPICVSGARLSSTGEMKNFTCPETEGRYVSIHISRRGYLQLCEVEVYGIYI